MKAKKKAKPAPKHKAKPAPKKTAARTQEPDRRARTMTTTESTERNSEPQAEPEESKFDLENCSREELIEIVKELTAENAELRGDGHDDEGEDVKPWVATPGQFTRGKLPGGKLIATDNATGAYFDVELEEWNRIPAR